MRSFFVINHNGSATYSVPGGLAIIVPECGGVFVGEAIDIMVGCKEWERDIRRGTLSVEEIDLRVSVQP